LTTTLAMSSRSTPSTREASLPSISTSISSWPGLRASHARHTHTSHANTISPLQYPARPLNVRRCTF
jgi:hypothetical protein